jgi:hypothetical protein
MFYLNDMFSWLSPSSNANVATIAEKKADLAREQESSIASTDQNEVRHHDADVTWPNDLGVG